MNLNTKAETEFMKVMWNNQRMRQHIARRLICVGVLFLVWVYINGGMNTNTMLVDVGGVTRDNWNVMTNK